MFLDFLLSPQQFLTKSPTVHCSYVQINIHSFNHWNHSWIQFTRPHTLTHSHRSHTHSLTFPCGCHSTRRASIRLLGSLVPQLLKVLLWRFVPFWDNLCDCWCSCWCCWRLDSCCCGWLEWCCLCLFCECCCCCCDWLCCWCLLWSPDVCCVEA